MHQIGICVLRSDSSQHECHLCLVRAGFARSNKETFEQPQYLTDSLCKLLNLSTIRLQAAVRSSLVKNNQNYTPGVPNDIGPYLHQSMHRDSTGTETLHLRNA